MREQGIRSQYRFTSELLEMFSLAVNAPHCHLSFVLFSLDCFRLQAWQILLQSLLKSLPHSLAHLQSENILMMPNPESYQWKNRDATWHPLYQQHPCSLPWIRNSEQKLIWLLSNGGSKKKKAFLLCRFFKIMSVIHIWDIFPLLTY